MQKNVQKEVHKIKGDGRLTHTPVVAAKCLRPAVISTTLVPGFSSLQPNNTSGIFVGVLAMFSFGPLPRIPKPHTNTRPSAEIQTLALKFNY